MVSNFKKLWLDDLERTGASPGKVIAELTAELETADPEDKPWLEISIKTLNKIQRDEEGS